MLPTAHEGPTPDYAAAARAYEDLREFVIDTADLTNNGPAALKALALVGARLANLPWTGFVDPGARRGP